MRRWLCLYFALLVLTGCTGCGGPTRTVSAPEIDGPKRWCIYLLRGDGSDRELCSDTPQECESDAIQAERHGHHFDLKGRSGCFPVTFLRAEPA